MGEATGIAWTDHTFNTWWGCTKVDEACRNCYALAWDKRTGGDHWGPSARRRFFGGKHWNEPRKWARAAAKARVRRRVFCSSMADVFELLPQGHPDGDAMDLARAKLWALIEETPELDWLLLTKRPELARVWLPPAWLRTPQRNVWLGTTVGAQDQEHRIATLVDVPAVIHFVSFEPLIGPIVLTCPWGIKWAILGGESGPGTRPCAIEWIRSLKSQLAASGIATFVKQLGDLPTVATESGQALLRLRSRKGGDMAEWPADLRVRQFPGAPHDDDSAPGAAAVQDCRLRGRAV